MRTHLNLCLSHLCLNPVPEPCTCTRALQPGYTVDVYDEDCWWVGIVKEVMATRIKVLLTGEL